MVWWQIRAGVVLLALASSAAGDDAGKAAETKVSYHNQIVPILRANCHGCHQPAKDKGEYLTTSYDALLKGGESEIAAIVPGNTDESYLLELITPVDGKAEMPQGKKPLAQSEIDLIRRWIEEGAVDDTPAGGRPSFDSDHPPLYTRPPVITSLDFSPDGTMLALAGFHEVLLVAADGSRTIARLVGMSERIESVRFSPDGSRLAVTGGLPCRMGEVQIWDVALRKLALSHAVTFDTVYGGSWSPDGKLVAFGCADKSVRAIEAATGKEVVYMAAHEDWIRGTVFSGDGKAILSVSRDKTVKMTDVATQRFLGNLTTHTPGVLRGGMIAIDRHPKRDEVLAGGADGAPKLFQMDVKAAPASGGNPNQIREYAALRGRVFGVRFSPDGTKCFAAGSLDGAGQVSAYETDSGKPLWTREIPETGIYALAASHDGKKLAAAGGDGQVRLVDPADGAVLAAFMPFEVKKTDSGAVAKFAAVQAETQATPPTPAAGISISGLDVEPKSVRLSRPTDYVQLVLTATAPAGSQADVTRAAAWRVEGSVGQITAAGRFTPSANGAGKAIAELGGQRVEIPVEVTGLDQPYLPDFIRDVNPVLTRLGCNAGTCHGAANGKNGFKLSLRGYDAVFDIRSLTDDLASRRVNTASPDDSLMLLKPTGAVPHQGGSLIAPGTPYYRTLREWIAHGARLDLAAPRVAKLEVQPQNRSIEMPGGTQQMRVVAVCADGTTRDVTGEAFLESGNTEVATVDRQGVATAVRRGEAAILARYEGAYAAGRLTIMGDRAGFVWQQPETWGKIDELVAAKWHEMKIQPSDLCSDAEFIRRVYLDLAGLPPSADEVGAFLADARDPRTKRDELIEKLIGSDDFVEHWANKWADLLQVNGKFLGAEGAAAFRKWIRDELSHRTPYNEFAHKLLTASGSNRENPAASYFKILRDPLDTMENTTHLFLGVRFNCNKCHDHPFERWTQDQYYQTAAWFARVELKPDPAAGDKKIGGTAIEGEKPLYETVADKADGEVTHARTAQVTPPKFPFSCNFDPPDNATRRQQIASWITSADNPYFARSYVNRLWGYLLGVGIIEPLDDIRAGNPPTNPELLDHLTRELIQSGFDARHVIRLICRSRTYQLSIQTNPWNADDRINYSHAVPRRLPAEVLYDTICRVVGSVSRIPGVPPGTRAAALPDAGIGLPDGFLANFGRPARESACECERSNDLQLGPVMALISGPTVDSLISDPGNDLSKLAASDMPDPALVEEIIVRILNRPAAAAEIETGLAVLRGIPEEHRQLAAGLEQLEKELAPDIAEMEKARQTAVDKASAELTAYEKEIAPREAELEKQHQQAIADAETALKQYESGLAERLAGWEEQAKQTREWSPLDPAELAATNGATLARQEDLSVLASGANGKGTYKFVARSDKPALTGIKLEALADERLPSKGPGRAPNGNFVLTEFRAEWTPEGQPDKEVAITLQNAQADFSQNGYEVASAIDGQKAPQNNGWATVPKIGEDRTAVFEIKDDAVSGPGTLTLSLDQEYADGMHTLGRFRISVTASPRPVTLDGLPKNIADILAVAADKRTDAQKAELLVYYRGLDGELKKLQQALAEAKKPRPVDPKLQQLRDRLSEAGRPVPLPPKLLQLRNDVALSTKQLAKARATFAQDLAWALINSPAFLFNR